MATDSLLERTRAADLQPLIVHGEPVYRNIGQLRIELQSLSQEHFELFAEPNADKVTGDIQWYAQVPGEKRKLADCGADDREQYEFQLARLVDEIAAHAAKLEADGDTTMAQFLLLALEIPDESHIFVVGEQPMLSGWGHVPHGPAAPRKVLAALSKRVMALRPQPVEPEPPAPPPPPPPPPGPEPIGGGSDGGDGVPPGRVPPHSDGSIPLKRHAVVDVEYPLAAAALRATWLNPVLWGILALLLLAIGHMLLRYCALVWPTDAADGRIILNYCEIPRLAAVDRGPANRNATLIAELRELERQLQEKRAACRPPPPPPQKESTDRVRRWQGQIGLVNVILTWNTRDDLDLHVYCPNGNEIYHGVKTNCGGTLDVDKNAGSTVTDPAENVVWTQPPPSGTYTVKVRPYSVSGVAAYKVELLIKGELVKEFNGSSPHSSSEIEAFTFTIPYPGKPL